MAPDLRTASDREGREREEECAQGRENGGAGEATPAGERLPELRVPKTVLRRPDRDQAKSAVLNVSEHYRGNSPRPKLMPPDLNGGLFAIAPCDLALHDQLKCYAILES